MLKECILHVGAEKTGTTSIQRFLAINRDGLMKEGWRTSAALAPHAKLGFLNHILLTVIARPQMNAADDLDGLVGVSDVQTRESVRSAAIESVKAELTSASSADSLILSNEHIHSRLRTAKQLSHLRDFVGEFAERIRPLVYLRGQHEMARALVNTALRQGSVVKNAAPRFDGDFGLDSELKVDKSYFDHDAFVTRLESVFGVENVIVKIYPERPETGNDVLEDFCGVLGISSSSFERPPRENTSFDQEGTRFLNAFNEYAAATPNYPAERVRARLLRYLSACRRGRGIPMDAPAMADFMSIFGEGNERLRARRFPDVADIFRLQDRGSGDDSCELNVEQALTTFAGFAVWDADH